VSDHNQTAYPYALAGLNGLVPNGLDYSSQNVSPHEGLIGESPHTPVTHHGLTQIHQPRLLVNGNHTKKIEN